MNDRDRKHWRRFVDIIEANDKEQEAPDFFRESDARNRRKAHLILVIRRKARQLKIDAAENLESLDESELQAIRFLLSKKLALQKMEAPTGEIAA